MPNRILLGSCAIVLPCSPLALHAQQSTAQPTVSPGPAASPTPAAAFTFDLGHAVHNGGALPTTYTVYATQPLASKLVGQKIRLETVESSPGGNATHILTINTGQQKTVAQMGAFVADILRRFAAGPVTAGQAIGKIGDLSYGGEIRFVADSADSLRYDIVTPEGPANGGHFNRAGAQAFVSILTGTPSPAPTASGG